MRRFNTAGPCELTRHYMIPPLERLPEAQGIVERGDYFVLHAPRQSGKTTTLRALARALTSQGDCAALHFSCETGEPAGDNFKTAQEAILFEIRARAQLELPAELQPPDPWPATEPTNLLRMALAEWARHCPEIWSCSSMRSMPCAARVSFWSSGSCAAASPSGRTPGHGYAVTVLRG